VLNFNLENDLTFKINILGLTIFFLINSISTNFNDGSDYYISSIYLFLIVGLLIFNSLFLYQYKIYFLSVIFISFLSIFYFFNFYPSKIFLGDSGAYLISLYPFLVFIISNFNLNIILISFHFLSPIIIDSLLTLYLRLKNKKNIFKPHSEHFFQKIVIQMGHIFLIKISIPLFIVNLIVYFFYCIINSNFFTLPFFSLLSYIIFRILIKKYVFRT
jgi:UDP-N-acetylmuramyl pentapeptide phosphotransferase/UDP-N-acetylglucosamine-1-phosphate transferase